MRTLTIEYGERDGGGMSAPEPDIWVVVANNDKPWRPGAEPDPDGPLVMETYTRTATREEAMRRAAQMESRGWGACRIARLVFDDQPIPQGPSA